LSTISQAKLTEGIEASCCVVLIYKWASTTEVIHTLSYSCSCSMTKLLQVNGGA
jgi:hypothetical protein